MVRITDRPAVYSGRKASINQTKLNLFKHWHPIVIMQEKESMMGLRH